MATDRLIQRSLAELRYLRDRAVAFESAHAADVEAVETHHRNSARNLLHYLSIRQTDIRSLQHDLHSLGLSSLGVLESHTVAGLNAVIACLEALARVPADEPPHPPVDFRTGRLLLREHARRLLGPAPRDRQVRIMVTMPSAAADDARLVEDLLRAGMDLMRINCAHDDATAWHRMAANLRRAEQVVGRRCVIQADLGGPKLRTGSMDPVGHFARIKPRRDATGSWQRRLESGSPAPRIRSLARRRRKQRCRWMAAAWMRCGSATSSRSRTCATADASWWSSSARAARPSPRPRRPSTRLRARR